MQNFGILLPLFVQVGLTFVIGFWLGRLRFAAVKRGDLSPGYYALNRGDEMPDYLARVSQNYDNLLELPILFYVVCILLILTGQTETTQLILAWLFVISRCIHSYIHTTYNNVLHRAYVFFVGVLALLVMWLLLSWRVVYLWVAG